MNKRVKYLDIARGIAIISVILGHLGNSSLNRFVFTYHLPCFFLITGYFMSDKQSIKSFFVRKVRTLLVPYVFACAGIIFFGTFFAFCKDGAEHALNTAEKWFLSSLFGSGVKINILGGVGPIGALWFLWATLWGSLLLRLTLNLKPWERLSVITITYIAAAWSTAHFWLPFSIQMGCCAALFMYCGYLIKQSQLHLLEMPLEVKAAWTIFAFFIWYAFVRDFKSFWLVQFDTGRGIIDIFGSLCASYCIFLLSWQIDLRLSRIGSLLAYIGRYSILILCVHIIELNTFPWSVLMRVLYHFGAPETFTLWYMIICKLAFDLSAATLLSQVPFIRKAFGLTRR